MVPGIRRQLFADGFREAVEKAVEECIKAGILADFLRKNRSEVVQMSIFEYDEELHIQTVREEGIVLGKHELVSNMLQKDLTPEKISELTNIPLEQVIEVQKDIHDAYNIEKRYVNRSFCFE